MIPNTFDEWKTYIAGLSREALISQFKAANSQRFTDTLLNEGKTLAEVEAVLIEMASTMVRLEIFVPGDGHFDIRDKVL